MTLKWRRIDVYETSSRRIDVILLLGETKKVCKKLSDLENEIYRVQ